MKSLGVFEIKDESRGIVEAVIATLESVDHDREVIRKGAIAKDNVVLLSPYRHDVVTGKGRPVGKGRVYERGNQAILEAQFFMKMEDGRETFEMVRGLGADGEWSLGFMVLKESVPSVEWKEMGAERMLELIEPVEASPVFRGASLGTMTLGVKERDLEAVAAKAKTDEEAAAAERYAEELAAAQAKAAADAEALEVKRREEEEAHKARVRDAVEDFHARQRRLRKLGVA